MAAEGKSSSLMPRGYTLHPGFPSVPEYLHLRAASGLTPKTEAQAAAVPSGSWYGCYIDFVPEDAGADGERPEPVRVGMGRVIGDGGWYFHIADMAVLPEHQRKGLGDAIVKHLLAHIKENAAEGDPYVTLFADPPGRKLYARNGFQDAAPLQLGMQMGKGWHLQ